MGNILFSPSRVESRFVFSRKRLWHLSIMEPRADISSQTASANQPVQLSISDQRNELSSSLMTHLHSSVLHFANFVEICRFRYDFDEIFSE